MKKQREVIFTERNLKLLEETKSGSKSELKTVDTQKEKEVKQITVIKPNLRNVAIESSCKQDFQLRTSRRPNKVMSSMKEPVQSSYTRSYSA